MRKKLFSGIRIAFIVTVFMVCIGGTSLHWSSDGFSSAFAAQSQPDSLVANGSFENGNFSGWTLNHRGSGNWFVSRNRDEVAPTDGNFHAISDQSGPGVNLLYQDQDFRLRQLQGKMRL